MHTYPPNKDNDKTVVKANNRHYLRADTLPNHQN